MREGDLTYDDFLQRLNIQDVLIDAGYHLNRRDGLRYPSYVRLDSEGRLALGNLLSQEMDDILASPRVRAIQKGFDARRPAEELCRRCGYAVRFNR